MCWVPSTNIGKSADWLMAIQRSGESIHLVYDVRKFPFPDVNHVGKVVAHDVVATSEGWTGAFACGGVRHEFRFEANVVLRFSADGGALTGKEEWSYRLTSGETVRMHFDWSATPAVKGIQGARLRATTVPSVSSRSSHPRASRQSRRTVSRDT